MRERASALFQRAVDYELQKNDFESLKHFEQAMKLFGAGADVVGEAISRRRIANILFRRGEFSEALALNRESLRVFERAKHLREIAYAQADIARCLRGLLHGAEAVPLFRSALDAEPQFGDRDWRVGVLSDLGRLLVVLGRHSEGLAALEERLALAAAMGDERETRIAQIDLAKAKRDPADDAAWIAELTSHLPFFERNDPPSALGVMSELTHLFVRCGRVDDAERIHARREALLKRLASPLDRADASYDLAAIRSAQGRTAEALVILRMLLDEYARLGASGPREVVLRDYARLKSASSRFRWLSESWILFTDGFRDSFRRQMRSRER